MQYNVALDTKNQILIKLKDKKIYLDPRYLDTDSFTFVSHAHSDHLISKSSLRSFHLDKKILSSPETIAIAKLRGHDLGNSFSDDHDFRFVNTGHILGSRGLLIEDKIFYTGDLSMRDRGFLKKTQIPKVDTLIIESTFGKKEYVFPPLSQVLHTVNTIISELYDKGVPVILLGYSLGKAQTLMSLFGLWKPLFVHDEILMYNAIHRQFGIHLEPDVSLSHAMELGLLNKKPWVLLHPLTTSRKSLVPSLKKKFGAVTIGFSGWGVNNGYKAMMNLDYVIPFSDHCDFNELVEVVKICKPRKVFTFHGFTAELSRELIKLGYDAEPIIKNQTPQKKIVEQNLKNNLLDKYI